MIDRPAPADPTAGAGVLSLSVEGTMRKLDPNAVAVVAAILMNGGHVSGADDDARNTVAVNRAIAILGVAHDQIEEGYGQRPDEPEAGGSKKKRGAET